jgi:hypothetical protein
MGIHFAAPAASLIRNVSRIELRLPIYLFLISWFLRIQVRNKRGSPETQRYVNSTAAILWTGNIDSVSNLRTPEFTCKTLQCRKPQPVPGGARGATCSFARRLLVPRPAAPALSFLSLLLAQLYGNAKVSQQ